MPWPAGGNIAVEMRDHALRQVVRLDFSGDGKLLQLRHEAPVTANDAPDEAPMAKVVESTLLPIALTSGIDESEVTRLTGTVGVRLRAIEEPRLERDGNVLREADPDETSRRDSVA